MAHYPSFPQPAYPSEPNHPGYEPQYAPTSAYASQEHAHVAQYGTGGTSNVEAAGAFEGVKYRIAYRDSNSLLSLRLGEDTEVKAKPGSMVAMDSSVTITGKVLYLGLWHE